MANQKLLFIVVATGVGLISLGVAFKLVVEPIYNKYELSKCVSSINADIAKAENDVCSSAKQGLLTICLYDAQHSIYCRDGSHRAACGPGFFSQPFSTSIAMVPDDSTGYWDNNSAYQALAQKCQQDTVSKSCDDILDNWVDPSVQPSLFCSQGNNRGSQQLTLENSETCSKSAAQYAKDHLYTNDQIATGVFYQSHYSQSLNTCLIDAFLNFYSADHNPPVADYAWVDSYVLDLFANKTLIHLNKPSTTLATSTVATYKKLEMELMTN